MIDGRIKLLFIKGREVSNKTVDLEEEISRDDARWKGKA